MNLLSIESAAGVVGAAVLIDGSVVAEENFVDRRHTELLSPAIESVVKKSGIALSQIDVIGVDCGPGLFTGLRVGIATAQGLAYGFSRPVVAVTSVEVLGQVARANGSTGDVLAVVDARRGEVFVARLSPEGAILEEPSRMEPESLRSIDGDGLVAIGDGARRYKEFLSKDVTLTDADLNAGALASVAAQKWENQESLFNAATLRPLYLRAPDAVSNWSKR
jgi:tRNA threonylcarbamoyladenosine biosynthesis protein TsaB